MKVTKRQIARSVGAEMVGPVGLERGRVLAVLVLALLGLGRPLAAAEPFDLDCGPGRVVTGISGKTGWYYWVYVVEEVRPSCVAVAPDGSWASSPWLGSTASPGGGDSFSLSCPINHAVFHISGMQGAVVDSLAVWCRSLADPEQQSDMVGAVGGDGGNQPYTSTCEGTQVATRLTGTSGTVIDSIALACADIAYGAVGSAPQLSAPASNAIAADPRPSFTWSWNPLTQQDPSLIPYAEICITSAGAWQNENFCDVVHEPSEIFAFSPVEDLPFDDPPLRWTVRGCNLAGACGPWAPARRLNPPPDQGPEPTPEGPTASFVDDLYPVYAHPRCTNCHNGYNPFNNPSQTGNHPLGPLLTAPGDPSQCAMCHNPLPTEDDEWRNWKLPDMPNPAAIPPFSTWTADFWGTGAPPHDAAEICATVRTEVQQVKQWNAEQFEEHVRDDVLIGWAFAPGPPMDDVTSGQSATDVVRTLTGNAELDAMAARAHFVAVSMGWFEAGMPCVGDVDEAFAYEEAFGMAGAERQPRPGGAGDRGGRWVDLGPLIGIDGLVLLREGAGEPIEKTIPELDPPKHLVLRPIKVEDRPERLTFNRSPIAGGLTKERLRILEGAGLHPTTATPAQISRTLERVEREAAPRQGEKPQQ